MKNVHLIPTDKPSRLRIGDNDNFVLGLIQNSIVSKNDSYTNQHIYITSDEEIKEGDWYYLPRTNSVYKCNEDPTELNLERRLGVAKIILTTDPDLIGVQPIDDEFLEWFVKNPSCEFVEVQDMSMQYHDEGYYEYKIIIPQEEPKQLTELEVAIKLEEIDREEAKLNTCDIIFERAALIDIEENKQETLEDSIYQAIGLAANEQGIINQALATSKVMDVLKKTNL